MKYIRIGKIINTHGIKGELKIQSYSDFDDERYRKDNTVYVLFENAYIPMKIRTYRVHKGFPLITFNELNDINLVEKYKNSELFIEESQREKLTDGRHYISDMIDMDVFDESGNKIGVVIEVEDTRGAQKNVRIRKEDGNEALVPYVPVFVKEVNEEENKMVIHVVEGLL